MIRIGKSSLLFSVQCFSKQWLSKRNLLDHRQAAIHFNKNYLTAQYNQRKELLEGKKLPPDVDPSGVFANDETDLDEIDVYGFDYDYTLATYQTSVEELIHHCAKHALVDKFKYPETIRKFNYDPKFAIRGLHYDIEKGLLLKIDSFLQITLGTVHRGRQQLREEEVLALYKRRHLKTEMINSKDSTHGLVQMVDTFAKPKMCLLVDVIQWFLDQKITYEPQSIYEDVQASIELAHQVFHQTASTNPESLLEKDPMLKTYLERLKQGGKQTFVITNSPYEIVNEGMKYLVGESWQTLFDVIIVSARKPSFFKTKSKHFRIYSPKVKRFKWKPVLAMEQGMIYTGGSLAELQRLTGWGDDRVLYFGDHPYADLADLVSML